MNKLSPGCTYLPGVRSFKMELEKRWKELCAQATVENDPQRLSQLVAEIVRLLDLQKAQQKNNDDTKRGTAE